ncbi:ribonuclease HI family protein [Limnoglobus roseus]|uniref:Ribonuclease H n=1 Tax=Limnoglobus roseus TaxID=2598579 RepID=A0A5C1AIF7_9BACT|nr:ribonuclease HI family protein [Limnoglobus roseus]QEL18043.1 ribonuclease H [Limnoglobus roseus]
MIAEATLNIDGGSRGNPGPASYAVVLSQGGRTVIEEAETIGTATNNVAEYTALVRGLEVAAGQGVQQLTVLSDSELLVKQMNGEYRVKNADLQGLFRQAGELRQRFRSVTLSHVRREQNKRADFLCNEAMDGRPRRRGEVYVESTATPPRPSVVKPAQVVGDERVRDDAVECLQAAAEAWAAHGPKNPPPAMVWEQLWSILEEGDVLKKR